MNSLRRLLANILYTGSIQHHGKPTRANMLPFLRPAPGNGCRALIAHGGHHAWQGTEQTSGPAQRTALLRILRDADGVHVCEEERIASILITYA